MIVMVCLDDKNGMMFNGRRQSKDQVLRERIGELTREHRLWMNSYSGKQFGAEEFANIQVDEAFLQKAEPGEFCFVEDQKLLNVEEKIEKLIVFRWNRVYPADQHLDLDITFGMWKCLEQTDFAGHSHEKITMEVYER